MYSTIPQMRIQFLCTAVRVIYLFFCLVLASLHFLPPRQDAKKINKEGNERKKQRIASTAEQSCTVIANSWTNIFAIFLVRQNVTLLASGLSVQCNKTGFIPRCHSPKQLPLLSVPSTCMQLSHKFQHFSRHRRTEIITETCFAFA